MLISFKVSNYKSILEPVCLNMLADTEEPAMKNALCSVDGLKEKVNPFSVIMGANGSGKSSIIDALKFVKSICLRQKTKTILRNRLAPPGMPSNFEVCFSTRYYCDTYVHKYALTVFGDGKVTEEIYKLENGSWNKLITYNFVTYENGRALSPNELNINWSSESYYKIARADDDIYCFALIFFKELIFFNSIDNYNDVYSNEQLSKELRDKIDCLGPDYKSLVKENTWPALDDFKEYLIDSLNCLGINVTDLKFELVGTDKWISGYLEDRTFVSPENFNAPEVNEDKNGLDFIESMKTLGLDDLSSEDYENVEIYYLSELVYGAYSVPVSEESSGTKRLLNLAFLLNNNLFEHEVCVVIDEMDAGLHESLAAEVIRQFRCPDPEGCYKGAQLIITSHNTVLLKDPSIRKDQIWFAEMKEENRTTDLYSLADLKGVKSTEDFAENYLRGAYGAIPRRILIAEENENE